MRASRTGAGTSSPLPMTARRSPRAPERTASAIPSSTRRISAAAIPRLSFFGLVPAALMGIDIEALVAWGLAMLARLGPGSIRCGEESASVALGLAIGAGAKIGRDKLTLVLPPALDEFGLWVEQLIAEAHRQARQGRRADRGRAAGRSIRLRIGSPVRAASDETRDTNGGGAALQPLIDIDMPEPVALGAEFMRWGDRHSRRRRAARDQSVRRAGRTRGEGRDEEAAR